MLEPMHSASTSPAGLIDRSLMAADLERIAALLAPAFLQAMPEIGLAAKALRLAPGRASSLLGSDLTRRISARLDRALDLPDDELALIVDAIALRLAAWRRIRPLTPASPDLDAALEHLRSVLA